MLEKYLLTITGYAVFRFILPVVCVLLIVRQFRSSEILAKLAFKLALFRHGGFGLPFRAASQYRA